MKKLAKFLSSAIIVVVLLLSFNSCDCIKGEGPIVSEDRNLKDFDGIELDISANVYLEKSNTFKFRIEAQENILDEIETFVSAGLLHIRYDNLCVMSRRSVRIYISMPELTDIEVGGSGKVLSSDVFDCNNLRLRVSGSGDIELGAIAKTIECVISGSGEIDLRKSEEIDVFFNDINKVMSYNPELFHMEKEYSKTRAEEVFFLINNGATVTNDKLFKNIDALIEK